MYSDINNNFDMNGKSLYNALQVSAEKRYGNGLGFLVSYTLGRSLSNTSSGFSSFANRAIDKANQAPEYTIDGSDQKHIVTLSGTYELPFGRGRPFLNHGGFVNQLVGGWQISPILTYSTGTPLGVSSNGDPLGSGGGNRANIVPGVQQQFDISNVYKGLPVLNPAAFAAPGTWVVGNSPRLLSTIRSPSGYNEDIAVAKNFPITESIRLKLEMEYFNALNRLIFGAPNTTNINDANFGKIINSQANQRRQGQIHLTLYF